MNFRLSRYGFRYLFQEEFQDMISVPRQLKQQNPRLMGQSRDSEGEWARMRPRTRRTGNEVFHNSSRWEDEEAAEDAIGLLAVVNAALTDIFFNQTWSPRWRCSTVLPDTTCRVLAVEVTSPKAQSGPSERT